MSKITFLGVWMTPDVGETVSFEIDIDNNCHVLIDSGTNLVGSLLAKEIDPQSITHIIITHSHGDHISGLPTYLFYRLLIAPHVLGKKSSDLKIIGLKSTLESVKNYIRTAYGALADNPTIQYTEIDLSRNLLIGNSYFHFFTVRHQPETIGFCTSIDGKRIVYSSDTGISKDVFSYAKEADLLIHDVVGTSKYSMLSGSHTLCSEISPLLKEYNIKCFYPVHRLSVYKDDIEEYFDELKKDYQGNIVIPNDGDVITISDL